MSLVSCWLLRGVLWFNQGVPSTSAFKREWLLFFGKLGCAPFYGSYGENEITEFKGFERDPSDVWSLVMSPFGF